MSSFHQDLRWDVVVQGYRPGVLDKYGFSLDGLLELTKDRKRGLIVARENYANTAIHGVRMGGESRRRWPSNPELPKNETRTSHSQAKLARMTDTDTEAQRLQWFHKLWTDEVATSWNFHGPYKSFTESRLWMIEMLTKYDLITYATFTKETGKITSEEILELSSSEASLGKLIGSVGLRLQYQHTLVPPVYPDLLRKSSYEIENKGNTKSRNARAIGYSFIQSAWGKGYTTEGNVALLNAYSASRAQDNSPRQNYAEATVSNDNTASICILEKLGFHKVGWKTEMERRGVLGLRKACMNEA
ncbi:hypothetical protein CC78DRAFT_576280 [Lojkania enalia]|uniref:N-acetyltransferase domain-containing protein n=1 Tax=Lojkania enalia TaxID=147567 RepID=A0A9P4N955_9PLEO|nr:hypothetical protein CC78DRAFT_576280 [Didymosphaeria enalia]